VATDGLDVADGDALATWSPANLERLGMWITMSSAKYANAVSQSPRLAAARY
jgi:hypothetical protein